MSLVFPLMRRQCLILPRVSVSRLHCSPPSFGKPKKPKKGPLNQVDKTASIGKPPVPPNSPETKVSATPSTSTSPSTEPSPSEAASSPADATILTSTSSTTSGPSSSESSSESAPPSPDANSTTANPSPPPAQPENSSLTSDEQYMAFRGRQSTGPFTWKAAALFVLTGAALVIYFGHEKERVERMRIAEENKSVGTPRVGGPYSLIDHHGKKVSQETYAGKHTLIYFGFTRCPDICPEELDKMAKILDAVNGKGGPLLVQPLFITCDPARDDPASLKKYLSEFHPDIIGLTGTWDDIKQTCKYFRVYFSTPPNVKPGQDYLVDHSIFFYLMDPENNFVEVYGRNVSDEETAKKILGHIKDWEKANKYKRTA